MTRGGWEELMEMQYKAETEEMTIKKREIDFDIKRIKELNGTSFSIVFSEGILFGDFHTVYIRDAKCTETVKKIILKHLSELREGKTNDN